MRCTCQGSCPSCSEGPCDCTCTPEQVAAGKRRQEFSKKRMEILQPDGATRIAYERSAHLFRERWTAEGDDKYVNNELLDAAICYIEQAGYTTSGDEYVYAHYPMPDAWPFASSWWKPKDPVRDLERAGALIAAEIDRRKRAEALEKLGPVPKEGDL